MATFIAFYDANVLDPAELRNFLMHLALSGVFRAKWSANVHDEWIRSLLANRPDLSREKLERTRQLMDKAAPDALVTGYESLIPGLQLPDPERPSRAGRRDPIRRQRDSRTEFGGFST